MYFKMRIKDFLRSFVKFISSLFINSDGYILMKCAINS
jgi:hypothetical protein